MNDEHIERLLRQGTLLKTPDGLLSGLIADIRLPRTTARIDWQVQSSWFKRWLPALSFAAFLMLCLVVIAVESNKLNELTHQNEMLRADLQQLDALRNENQEYQRLAVENQELERLRKDNLELKKLHEEMPQLIAQTQPLETLRAENKRLHVEVFRLAAAKSGETNDFFADEKAKAERIHCASNLRQTMLALRLWEGDNRDTYPPNLISMTNELNTWQILQCPSDKAHKVSGWADVAAGNVSYHFIAPGFVNPGVYPEMVVMICPIHHNIGLADGSVQQLSPEAFQKKIKVIDGKMMMTH